MCVTAKQVNYAPKEKAMAYTCQNCGIESEDCESLCNPTNEELTGTFCGISSGQVCGDRLEEMKFSCDSCGRVSPDAEHLCKPVEIR